MSNEVPLLRSVLQRPSQPKAVVTAAGSVPPRRLPAWRLRTVSTLPDVLRVAGSGVTGQPDDRYDSIISRALELSSPSDPPIIDPPRNPKITTPPELDPKYLIEHIETPRPFYKVVKRVEIKPGVVPINPAWGTALRPAMTGGMLDLRLLTSKHLDRLTDEQLENLLDSIAGQEQTLRYIPGGGIRDRYHLMWRSQRKGVSSVSALALQLYARGRVQLVERLVNLRPINIARDLHEIVPNIFTLDLVAQIMPKMISNYTRRAIDWDYPEVIQADAMGNIVEAFLISHATDKPEVIEAWVTALLLKLEDSDLEPSSANLGSLTGAVIAGGLKYAAFLKSHDQDRYYMYDKGSQLFWAATQMAYQVPAVPGVLAIVAVVGGIMLEKWNPIRDLSTSVIKLEGGLRTKLSKLQVFRSNYELGNFFVYLNNVKMCNGWN